MDATGTVNHASWIAPEDAFLCRDLNGNGKIDDASELFSSTTDPTTRTGFEALARLDDNEDGVIDAKDDVYETLLVWRDMNIDGQTQPAELSSISAYNIAALPLTKISITDANLGGDLLFGGDACTMSSSHIGPNTTFLFEVGLVTLTDPEYLQGLDLPGGIRQYFGKDASRLIVLESNTSVDLADLKPRTIFGSPQNDLFDASAAGVSPVFVRGGAGDDVLIGGDRPDFLEGEKGADHIDGGAGNDFLWIDGDDTYVQGGEGFDVVIVEGRKGVTIDMFTAGIEVIYGGTGNDVITMSGGNYAVRVRADVGNDTVILSGGDDFISPGPGNDTIDGGGGKDTVEFTGDLDEYDIDVVVDDGVTVVTVIDTVDDRDGVGTNDGTTMMRNVEKLVFDDQTRQLDGRNSAPVIITPPIRVVRGETLVTFEPFELISLAIEFDGETLSLFGVGAAINGALTILENGTITFVATEGFTGRASFEFTVQDPNGSKATGVLNFIILPPLPEDTLFKTQWHHDNIRAVAVWDTGITGAGVTVRVNDDKLQMDHPDMLGQLDVANSYDYEGDDSDPSPRSGEDAHHGTFVTGLITATKNGIGIIGVAYNAVSRFGAGYILAIAGDTDVINLSFSRRPIFATSPTKTYDKDDTIWGNGQDRSRRDDHYALKFVVAARTGRGGLGSVSLAAAGNQRLNYARSDGTRLANERHVMSIGAHDIRQVSAYFSSKGACVHVSCPGKDITSTDRTGDEGYSTAEDFLSIGVDYANAQGTSFSSPICSGIAALMLEARPELGWRDIHEIIGLTARTAAVEKTGLSSFVVNGARHQPLNGGGLKSNEEWGFGAADAFGAVRLAQTWILSPSNPARTSTNEIELSRAVAPNALIPDGGELNHTIMLSSPQAIRLMHVELGLRVVHPRLGDLVVIITSPSGTSGTLVTRSLKHTDQDDEEDHGAQSPNLFFRFSSLRQWGEDPAGTWILTIRDAAAGETGTLESWDLRTFGDYVNPDNLYLFTEDYGQGVTASGYDTLRDVNGGNDTINVSPVQDSVIIDLTPGSQRSLIRGLPLIIDLDTEIENVFCGDGDDTVVGNDERNVIRTGRGDDILKGSAAADIMDGGEGFDKVDYGESDNAISVSLVPGDGVGVGGHADGDILIDIEHVIGSPFDDTIRGSSANNDIEGGSGIDTIFGGQGDDTIKGGYGSDNLHGEDGDDTIHPEFGENDRVDCGPGLDVIVMLGHSTDYTLTYGGTDATVTDGVNTVRAQNCEFIQYSNRRELLSATANLPPSVQTPIQFATLEDTPLRMVLANVTSAINDPEQDAIELVFVNGAKNGVISLESTALIFTPAAFFNGVATVSVTVTDNKGNFLPVTLEIFVVPVNSEPECPRSKLSVPESRSDTVFTGNVQATDIDGDALVYSIETGPAAGDLSMSSAGTFEFSRGGLAGTELQATYRATDLGGLTCTGTLDIQVTGLVRFFSSTGTATFRLNVTTIEEASAQYSSDFVNEIREGGTSFAHEFELGGPQGVFLPTGELVYVWAAVGIDNSGIGVAARLFDTQGNGIGPSFTVNTFTEGDQGTPAVIALAGGDFVIVWKGDRQDKSSSGIFFKRYDRFGFTVGDETQANDEAYSTQSGPSAIALPDGGYIIAWESFAQDGDDFGVYARVYDRFGKAANPEFQLNAEIEGIQQNPSLCVVPSGDWLAVWEGTEAADGSIGVFGRRYRGENALGDEFRVNIGSADLQFQPMCVALAANEANPDGSWLVIFSDIDGNPAPADGIDITGVHLSVDGSVRGSEIRMNRRARGTQLLRGIVPVPNGFDGAGDNGIMVLWEYVGVEGQLLTNDLGFVDQQYYLDIPARDGSFMFTNFTLLPFGASTSFNGGVFASGHQVVDFERRTMQLKLQFRRNADTFDATAPLTLLGGEGADTLYGSDKADTFFGAGGNDTFFGRQGASIDDRVIYRGPRAAYNLSQLAPSLWTVASIETGEVDLLDGIEEIEFTNAVIRVNSPPAAVNDVVDPLSGSYPILDNDMDAEDGAILPSSATIVIPPLYGRASIDGDTGSLEIRFEPGATLGFSNMVYAVSDSAGLTAQAVVRVRFDCANVPGTTGHEEIVTGSAADAAACGNNFSMAGNGGADVFTIVKRLGGTDIITDFALTGDGADQIGLSGFPSISVFDQVLLTARQVGDDTVIDLEGVHTLILQGVELNRLGATHFSGTLGRAALVVNTFPGIGAGASRIVLTAVDSFTPAETAARGDYIEDELVIRSADVTQMLVVWESFPSNLSGGALQEGALPAQDGSEIGLFGQFLGPDGEKRGTEFQITTTTSRSQFAPAVIRQIGRSWFWVLWSQVYDDGAGNLFSELMGNAFLFNGEAMCTLRYANCDRDSRGVPGPDAIMAPRFAGEWLNPFGVTTHGDGIGFPGLSLTYGAFVRTPTFCCGLYVVSYADQSGSTINIDAHQLNVDFDGTVLSNDNNRAAMGALSFDRSLENVGDRAGTFIGQLVVVGWLRNVRTVIRSLHDPPQSGVSVHSVLTLRLHNSFTGESLQTIAAVEEIGHVDENQWVSHLSAFSIVPLNPNAIPPNSSVDGFGQFAVVHGFRYTGTIDTRSHEYSERIAMSLFTRRPGNANECSAGCPGFRHHGHTLHSRYFVNSVNFDTNERRRLSELGLSACAVVGPDGGSIAVAWGHKFAFSERPVILVQLFNLAGEALGPYVVASGYAGGRSGIDGVSITPHNPQITRGADGNSVVVVWSQAVVPSSGTVPPNTNVYSKAIPLAELVRPVPYCADDVLSTDEDTAFEVSLDDILANDGESARDVLRVVGLRVVPEKSELVVKNNGSIVSTTETGSVTQRLTAVRRSGLQVVYFPTSEALPHLRVRAVTTGPSTVDAPTPALQITPPPTTAPVEGELTCNHIISGDTTGAANNVGNDAGEHVYHLTVRNTGDYSFSTCNASEFDSNLRLFTASGDVLGTTEKVECAGQIVRRLDPGFYSLVVEGTGTSEGNYTLATSCKISPYPPAPSPLAVDFERIGFDQTPNPFTFPPDVLGKLTTFSQNDGSRNSWPGLPRYMTSNFFASVTGDFTLDRDEDRVEFLVTASSAAALWIDGELVQVSRDRRPYNDTLGALSPPPPPPPPVDTQCCPTVMASRFGTQTQGQKVYIGLYNLLDGVIVNDHVVYSNGDMSTPRYIFFSTSGLWIIGRDYTSGSGGLYASSTVACPSDVPAWFVYHGGRWNQDVVSIDCGGCCSTVQISGDDEVNPTLMAVYTKVPGLTRVRRPVYRRQALSAPSDDFYLFYSAADNGWLVGRDIDSNIANIWHSQSRQGCPDHSMVGGWQVYQFGPPAGFTDKPDLQVGCGGCCGRLNITGIEGTASYYMGEYELQFGRTQFDRAVYKHTENDVAFLFHRKVSGISYWLIGQDPDQADCKLYATGGSACPTGLINWHLYDDQDRVFNLVGDALNATCSGCCDSMTVGGIAQMPSQGFRMGTYTRLDGVRRGGRPVFSHVSIAQFIFFKESSGLWLIGSDYDVNSGGMYSRFDTDCPSEIPDTAWLVYDFTGRRYVRRPLSVSCGGVSTTIAPQVGQIYTRRSIGNCATDDYEDIDESIEACNAAARSLGLDDVEANRTDVFGSTLQALNKLPRGCYFKPINDMPLKLFWSPTGLGNADNNDTVRLSICTNIRSHGAGRFVAGSGVVEGLSGGRHTLRLQYYSDSREDAEGESTGGTAEFSVQWRRQSSATECSLESCHPDSFSLAAGVDESAFQQFATAACCGSEFEPIPSTLLSHEEPRLVDTAVPYTYMPPADTYGLAVLSYEVANPTGGRCTAEINVTISPTNEAPVAVDDRLYLDTIRNQLGVECDTAQPSSESCFGVFTELVVPSTALLANDFDLDEDTLVVTDISSRELVYGQLGTVASTTNGNRTEVTTFSYIPTTGYRVGQQFFTVAEYLQYGVADTSPGFARAVGSIIIEVRHPLRRCAAGEEYEVTAPTATSDRRCIRCSRCASSASVGIASGLFEVAACSATTDRSCLPLTACDPEVQYESRPPLVAVVGEGVTGSAFTSDRICANLTVCAADQYESIASDGLVDRTCSPLRICEAGSFVTRNATLSTARECQTCPTDTYQPATNQFGCVDQPLCASGTRIDDVSFEHAATCVPCTVGSFQSADDHRIENCTQTRQCPAGTMVGTEVAAGASVDQGCIMCNDQTEWQDAVHQTDCKAASSCRLGQETASDATPTSDRTCSSCIGGITYQDLPGTAVCKPVLQCGVGEQEASAPTTSSNRVCETCPDETFQEQSGQLVCDNATTCGAGHEEIFAATSSADRMCQPCNATTFQALPGAHACELLTECQQGEEQAVAPSSSSDRICLPCGVGEFQDSANQVDCSGHTVCTAGQETSVEATSTTDRECRPCPAGAFKTAPGNQACTTESLCQVSTEEESPPSTTADRVCRPCLRGSSFQDEVGLLECKAVTACLPGQREVTMPTLLMDRQCEACPDGTYQIFSGGSDREASAEEGTTAICTPVSECGAGQQQLVGMPTTSSSDRICVVCGVGHYQSEDTGTHPCLPGTVCLAGQEEAILLTVSSDRLCAPCQPGTFKVSSGQRCQNVTKCGPGTGTTVQPSPSADRVCETCGAERFQSRVTEGACKAALTCQAGEEEKLPPSASSDRECQSCIARFSFQPLPGAGPCQLTRVCRPTEYAMQEPTVTTDRQCQNLTRCGSGTQFQSLGPSQTSDRQCNNLTACEADVSFEARTPTVSSDRQCQNLTACAMNEYEAAAPTSTVDRSCILLRECRSDVSARLLLEFETRGPTPTTNRVCQRGQPCQLAVTYEELPVTRNADRSCAQVIRCGVDEFETLAPSLVANRECSTTRNCTSVEFQALSPTATTDRACVRLDVCAAAGEFITRLPTVVGGPVECTPIRPPCDALTEFESVAPTLMKDRVCSDLTWCNTTQYVSVAATATSDRACGNLTVCDAMEPGDVSGMGSVTGLFREPGLAARSTSDSDEDGGDSNPETSETPVTTLPNSPAPSVSCSQCESETDVYGQETCEFFLGNGMCDQHRLFCARTCCIPEPCSTTLSPSSTAPTGSPTSSTTTSPLVTTTGRSYEESVRTTLRSGEPVTEFEAQASTSSSDRVCATLTECVAARDEYEQAAPTASSNRACRRRSVCDVTLRPELEHPPVGAETVEVFPGSPTHDRVCYPFSTLCDFDNQYLHHASINYDVFALGALRSSWNNWAELFDPGSYGEVEALQSVSYDTARSFGMWDALFSEVDVNNDRSLDRNERDRFRAQNLTGRGSMETNSAAAVLEGSSDQPQLIDDWQCTSLSVCDPATQYQTIPKAIHLDRRCGNLSICDGVRTFESAPPSATIDRGCTLVYDCAEGEQQLAAPTVTSDRTCTDITDVPTSAPSAVPTAAPSGAPTTFGFACRDFQGSSLLSVPDSTGGCAGWAGQLSRSITLCQPDANPATFSCLANPSITGYEVLWDPARCSDSVAALVQLVEPYAAGTHAVPPTCSLEGLVRFLSAQMCGEFVRQLNYALEDTMHDGPQCSADALCSPCEGNTNSYGDDTCKWISDTGRCGQYRDLCALTCCSEEPAPCSTTPGTTQRPTTTLAATPTSANEGALCNPCDSRSDTFGEDTCQYFAGNDMCEQYESMCSRTCCTAPPERCETTPGSTTLLPTTVESTTSAPTNPSPTIAMCSPCDDLSDNYSADTCQYFAESGQCGQYGSDCSQTCCTAAPEPCTSTLGSTTATPPTTPPPTTQTTPACPRNCGQSANGGGTCVTRSSGIKCTSCNANRLLVKGKCLGTVSCKGRRIQTGSLTGQGCRCLNSHCHFCTRVADGDTCRVCRDGWYLLDGECQASCPPTTASSGVGQFKRRCAAPFTCQSGRLLVSPTVNYGCKCATEDNSAIADCQICEHRAGEHGEHCTRCNAGKFFHSNRCHDTCVGLDGADGLIEYAPGTFGRECRAPFTCDNRVGSDGRDCKCDRTVGKNDCLVCDYGTAGTVCSRCTNSKFLRNGNCVDACFEGETASGDGRDGRECT